MSRLFVYGRVSTAEQNAENQVLEIEQAGYKLEPKRIVLEKVSGAIPAELRDGFKKLKAKLETGDTLIVTKLDRLGRDSIDVQQQVEWFKQEGIRLIVLQLGNLDLTSEAGAFTLKILAAVADFERGLIRERTLVGQAKAWLSGKTKGRPTKTTSEQRQTILQRLTEGVSVSQLAREYKISRASVISIRKVVSVA
jgi:putative DNA-invertase from lambdoid prophage Rac